MESKKGKTSKCDNINICSININGLNNKLNTIQNLMHNNYIDIMCVQETHDINKLNLENGQKSIIIQFILINNIIHQI